MDAVDVLVIGGGNAALCAALTAREQGCSVRILEFAPKVWRGGNSTHTRNIRCMHTEPEDVLTGAYPEDEFFEDLLKVTSGQMSYDLARLVVRESSNCRVWMKHHGVRFQPSLGGTLHLSRTNAFFLGGGKALVNAYYRAAESSGIQISYEAFVESLDIDNGRFKSAQIRLSDGRKETVTAKTAIVASGGFESNRDWLREAWGPAADNFLIRGTKFNTGAVLRDLIAKGAETVGDPTQGHAVAVDARAPLYDGGIVTRIDCVSLGIVVNKNAERFYDEGEDFWPKRYAIWGRLVAQQPDQIALSIIDRKACGRFMPPVYPGETAQSISDLAVKLGLLPERLALTVEQFNKAVRPGSFNHAVLDDCQTEGIYPAKTHWALPINDPPFTGYPLRPGITFTYLGLKVDRDMRVLMRGASGTNYSENLFAAGEICAGNVLGKGYIAGVGMTIGTVFGRIAGKSAARAAGARAEIS